MQAMSLEVSLALEVLAKSSSLNQLSSIIPSTSDPVNSHTLYLLLGHYPLNLILLVFTCENGIRGPLMHTPR